MPDRYLFAKSMMTFIKISCASIFLLVWVVLVYKYLLPVGYRKYWIPFLTLKLVFGLGAYFLYFEHYQAGDMVAYLNQATIYQQADVIPNPFSRIIPDEVQHAGQVMESRNAIFFAKLVALLKIAMGHDLIVVTFFALFSATIITTGYSLFVGRDGPEIIPIEYWAFFMYPSVLFWASGVFKEAIAFPLILLSFGFTLKLSDPKATSKMLYTTLLMICLVLLWYVKYFLVATALTFIVGLLLHHFFSRFRWPDWACFLAALVMLAIPVGLLGQLHYNLNIANLWGALFDTHQKLIANSNAEALVHFSLTSSWLSVVDDVPKALLSGLFFPLPWQAWSGLSWIIAIENLILLVLLFIGIGKRFLNPQKLSWSKMHWWLIVYVVISALLIGLATPNMGTLARYKIVYMPFLVFLLLSTLQSRTKPSHSV